MYLFDRQQTHPHIDRPHRFPNRRQLTITVRGAPIRAASVPPGSTGEIHLHISQFAVVVSTAVLEFIELLRE
jgi:hypothetical protein